MSSDAVHLQTTPRANSSGGTAPRRTCRNIFAQIRQILTPRHPRIAPACVFAYASDQVVKSTAAYNLALFFILNKSCYNLITVCLSFFFFPLTVFDPCPRYIENLVVLNVCLLYVCQYILNPSLKLKIYQHSVMKHRKKILKNSKR